MVLVGVENKISDSSLFTGEPPPSKPVKLLVPIADLVNYRSGTKCVPCECEFCGNEFLSDKREVNRVLSGKKPTVNRFCSHSCQITHQHRIIGHEPKTTVICKYCNKKFIKDSNQIKRSINNFCSHSCATTYNNQNKTKGTRMSKFEIYCQKRLPIDYPDLEFHFNQKDAIGSELDIFIPSIRLAFELNGIVHYEPIYGQGKLDQIQSNDQNKFHRCYENRISLCIIDVSSLTYNVEKRFIPFYEKIKEIIDKSLIIR